MCDNDALIVKCNMQIAPQTLVPICSEIQGFESDSEANGDVVKVKLEVFMGFANCLCYLKCFHMTAYDDDDDNVYDFQLIYVIANATICLNYTHDDDDNLNVDANHTDVDDVQ